MRIGVVSPHLPSPALPMRGVRHYEPLRLFVEAGHAVQAVVPVGRSKVAIPRVEAVGDVSIEHPTYFRPPRLFGIAGIAIEAKLFVRAAARALRSADVVLAHSATLPGGLADRVGSAAFVVTLHDHELLESAPRSKWLRAHLARTLRRADRAIYVSEALRRAGERLAGPHRAIVIPIGIDAFPDVVARAPERFTITAVARLVRRKRIDRLVRALARLVTTHPDARLVVVGDGDERPRWTALVRTLGVADRVEWTGALDARAARERIARSSVMALPSVEESLGAVYLEAMSLGVPALGTRGEGIEAHVVHGESGVLVPPDDDDALFAELRALADDPERARRIGDAGRRRFEAGPFTWNANVVATLAVLEETLRDRARGKVSP